MAESERVPQFSEDAEVKWTQLYAAIQAAQGRTLADAAAYGGGPGASDLPGSSLRNSVRLMSGFSPGTGWGETSPEPGAPSEAP